MVEVPNKALWMMTGNNPRFSKELTRRIVRIRIVDERDTPSDGRKTYRHIDLERWAREKRSRLVWAILVLIQAWIHAGCPEPDGRVLGGYEQWSRVIGGILQVAAIPGFLENRAAFNAAANAEHEEWRRFLKAWSKRFGKRPTTVGQLNELCERKSLLEGVRGDGSDRSKVTRLGQRLLQHRDRFFGDYQITICDARSHGKIYALAEK